MSSAYGMEESNSFKTLFLSKINKPIAAPLHRWCYPKDYYQEHEDASDEYQKLAKDAYDQLQVPLDQRLPVKKRDLFVEGRVGRATPSAIFIDQGFLNYKQSNSYKKHVLLHEITHVKYYDPAESVLVASGFKGCLGASAIMIVWSTGVLLSSIKYPQNLKKAIKGIFTACSIGGSGVMGAQYHVSHGHRLGESRADQTAFNALQCYKCVEEVKDGESDEAEKIGRGYWRTEQMQEVADKFKQQNKICLEHEKEQEQKPFWKSFF